jgi:hypothetical protein
MAKKDEEREKRLAEALRENLKRRKAQARGVDSSGESLRRTSEPTNIEGDS